MEAIVSQVTINQQLTLDFLQVLLIKLQEASLLLLKLMVLQQFFELYLSKLLTLIKSNVKMVLFKPHLIIVLDIHLMNIVTQDLTLMNVNLIVPKRLTITVLKILTLYSPNVPSVGTGIGRLERNVTMETKMTQMDVQALAISTLEIHGIVT